MNDTQPVPTDEELPKLGSALEATEEKTEEEPDVEEPKKKRGDLSPYRSRKLSFSKAKKKSQKTARRKNRK